MCLENLLPKCFLAAASVIVFPIYLEQMTWKSQMPKLVPTTKSYLWNCGRISTAHLFIPSLSTKGFWFKTPSPSPGMTRVSSLIQDHMGDPMRCLWTLEKHSWGIKSSLVLSPANQRKICTKVLNHCNILEYFVNHSVSQGNITQMSTHQLPQGGNCRIRQNCIVFKHFLLYPMSQILSTDLLFYVI